MGHNAYGSGACHKVPMSDALNWPEKSRWPSCLPTPRLYFFFSPQNCWYRDIRFFDTESFEFNIDLGCYSTLREYTLRKMNAHLIERRSNYGVQVTKVQRPVFLVRFRGASSECTLTKV